MLPRAESNDGVWITYDSQRWISAGPALPLRNAEFVRIGEYAGVPVFRRTGAAENMIYVLMHDDVIAPYRLKDRAEGVR
jgi:hypothetical protein